MNLVQPLNTLTKVLLGIGIIDIWEKALLTKSESQKAQQLADKKHLRQAFATAEKTLASWSNKPNFCESLLRYFLLGHHLDQLQQQLKQWRSQLAQANKLMIRAKEVLQQDTGNPLETKVLQEALVAYKDVSKILDEDRILRRIDQLQTEFQKRKQFQKLVTEADSQAENRFFHQAVTTYHEAEKLYATEALKQSIATCQTQVKLEETYSSALTNAKKAIDKGKLLKALKILEVVLTRFTRVDSIELLEKLKYTIKGKEKYRLGLQAEKAGNFSEALSLYKSTEIILPDFIECKIRISIVAIKTNDWATALLYLNDVEVEQTAYLRGFVYAKQGNLKLAHREWQKLSNTKLIESLKIISQRQRLLALNNIEQLVKRENLEQAKIASREFLENFGSDPLVEVNLNEHILPRLKATDWQNTGQVEKMWIHEPNLTNLHNWIVATYYEAVHNPVKVDDLIVALSTALANLKNDLVLQNLPWLDQPIELESVSLELKRRVEEVIDSFKDKNLEQYLKLRDNYRLEMTALDLMGNPPKLGMKVKDVFITPRCYQRYFQQWKDIIVDHIGHNQNILRSLYTSWGLAVAACVGRDTQRAIQLKPLNAASTGAELFAAKFIAYHEACYYLQEQKWQKAIIHLQHAKTEIKACADWQREIDRLSSLQRQAISKFNEHLEFAQFWYDILESELAKNYLAECKAEELREKLVNQKISPEKALGELKEIKKIDQSNPVVLDLITRVEFNIELQEIERLFQKGLYPEVVAKAKHSRHENIRFRVAEIFIEILMTSVNRGDLTDYKIMRQLANWAYEICPNEPAFREVYRRLNLC